MRLPILAFLTGTLATTITAALPTDRLLKGRDSLVMHVKLPGGKLSGIAPTSDTGGTLYLEGNAYAIPASLQASQGCTTEPVKELADRLAQMCLDVANERGHFIWKDTAHNDPPTTCMVLDHWQHLGQNGDDVDVWSEAPIVNAIPDFPFLEGSRAIVGSRQLQARFGLI